LKCLGARADLLAKRGVNALAVEDLALYLPLHFFDWLPTVYDRALVVALRHRFIALSVMLSTVMTGFTTPLVYIYMDRLGQLLGLHNRAARVKGDAPAQ